MISKEGNGIHLSMKGKRHKGKKYPQYLSNKKSVMKPHLLDWG